MNINKIINYKENNIDSKMSFINGSIVFTRDINEPAMFYSLKYRHKQLLIQDRLNGASWCNECKQFEPNTNMAGNFVKKYRGISWII